MDWAMALLLYHLLLYHLVSLDAGFDADNTYKRKSIGIDWKFNLRVKPVVMRPLLNWGDVHYKYKIVN